MRPPDLEGYARAWRIGRSPDLTAAHEREWGYEDGTVDTWIVNGPFHPFWSWWTVTILSLKDIPGAPPANKQYPEAEYEFIILSINPEPDSGRPKTPDVDGLEAGLDPTKAMPGFLMPPDAVVQFHGLNDEQARELCELAVKAIVNGKASPDSDYRSWWEKTIPTTVKHLRGEPH